MLSAVGAVLFHSENAQNLADFYRDVLGLTPDFGGEDGAQFSIGGLRIGLWQHSELHGPAKDPDRIIVNFLVDDAMAEFEELRRKGVEFIKPPTDEDWGGSLVTLASFRDPDGNLLQLLQFKG